MRTIEHQGNVVHLAQLTDTHLCKTTGGTLLGMDTDHSLQAVVDQLLAEQPRIDLVLGTGDMSDNGAPEAYQRLRGYFGQISAPACWLPGNHDIRQHMLDAAPDPAVLSRELRIGPWQVIMLDSQIPGEVGGELGTGELEHLEQCLAAAGRAGLHSLVCLHHQPVAVGSAWIDQQMVADADAMFAIIDRHPGAKAVLWGHVHQEIDRHRGDLRLLASPSTCVQFAPGSERFKADALAPGYRWLELHRDGRIETGVSRVQGVQFTVDLDSGGYL